MENLHDILKKKGYKKIKFKLSKTQHLLIKGKINGVQGNFILDTGASNSCIGFDNVDYFNLEAQDSPTQAAGAGATGMYTQMASDNTLQLSHWKTTDFSIVIFDMSHVNSALQLYKAKPVHGIIGADILLKGKAIIDYFNHYLYLK
ncbi:retroviral-like aspartic protease family protein [Flavobacterium sp. SM15]|uniref:retropepsin-like aspartic protease n=1 Tax=Flavobacterium sp. SM15 TaxID=2908005 RepID=UPI001EDBD45D|nr:retropepsin-like aspartic protease [Flavobacterium sp. SM15]MCG2610130.1 retroviral-like aspartic protease family protein [Flavobacterium sp. SM15]